MTDKLKSYTVARRELIPESIHATSRHANNRVELSHQRTRIRERGRGPAGNAANGSDITSCAEKGVLQEASASSQFRRKRSLHEDQATQKHSHVRCPERPVKPIGGSFPCGNASSLLVTD